jgi:hypothetical protein
MEISKNVKIGITAQSDENLFGNVFGFFTVFLKMLDMIFI